MVSSRLPQRVVGPCRAIVSAPSRNTKSKPLESPGRYSLIQSLHHGNVETQPSGPLPTAFAFRRPSVARPTKQITSSNAYLYHKLCETGPVDTFALVPGARLTAPLTGESSLAPAFKAVTALSIAVRRDASFDVCVACGSDCNVKYVCSWVI